MKIQLLTNNLNNSYGLNFRQKENNVSNTTLATNYCKNTGIICKNYALSSLLINKNFLKPISFGSNHKYQPMSKEDYCEKSPDIDKKLKRKGVFTYLNKFNILFAERYFKDEKLNENKNVNYYLNDILKHTHEIEGLNNRMETTDYLLSDEKYLNEENISKNLGKIIFMALPPKEVDDRIEFFNYLQQDERVQNNDLYKSFTEELSFTSSQRDIDLCKFVLSQDTKEIESKIDHVKQKIYEDVKSKCGLTNYTKIIAENKIHCLLDTDKKFLLLASCIYDKDTLAEIYKESIGEIAKQSNTLDKMSLSDIQLLMKMCNCHDTDGNNFKPIQKIDFAKYILDNELNHSEEFKEMVNTDSINLKSFNIKLLQKTLNKLFFDNQDVANEKSQLLNLDYATELNKTLYENDSHSLKHLLSLSFSGEFEKYITDEKTDIGQANKRTERMFKEYNMNYNYWLHPDRNIERQYKAVDTNKERLSQISNGLSENMNLLLNSPAKNLIKKQFPKYIKDDKFVLPTKISTNKHELEKLLNLLIDTSSQGQLTNVWKRATINKKSEDINLVKNATNTLTILDDLTTLSKEISSVNEVNGKKEYDITIKMWDRNPLKDIYQGNYSTCCIGMGNSNASCMPDYLMHSAFNMIELVDNKTNNIIGNSLCYFITDENNKPALVLDNIEINNNEKPSTETGIELRKELIRYASAVANKVTGKKDTPVLLGKAVNDLPTKELKGYKDEVRFLGDFVPKLIYLDAFKGFCTKPETHDDIFLYRCNSDM